MQMANVLMSVPQLPIGMIEEKIQAPRPLIHMYTPMCILCNTRLKLQLTYSQKFHNLFRIVTFTVLLLL
jgi:hypothetical protein